MKPLKINIAIIAALVIGIAVSIYFVAQYQEFHNL